MVNAVNNNRNIELVPPVLQDESASPSSAAVLEPRKASDGVLGGLPARDTLTTTDQVSASEAAKMVKNREHNAMLHVTVKSADMRANTTMSNADKTAEALKNMGRSH